MCWGIYIIYIQKCIHTNIEIKLSVDREENSRENASIDRVLLKISRLHFSGLYIRLYEVISFCRVERLDGNG